MTRHSTQHTSSTATPKGSYRHGTHTTEHAMYSSCPCVRARAIRGTHERRRHQSQGTQNRRRHESPRICAQSPRICASSHSYHAWEEGEERERREREEREREENERARFPPDDDSTRRRSIWQRHRLRLRRGNQPGSSLEILDSTTAVALGLQPIWM